MGNKTKLVLMLAIVGLLVGGLFIVNVNEEEKMEQNVYQGPVRPTDNEAHFRKTGETISLEVSE